MRITPLGIEGSWLIESAVHKDHRGFFTEWFKWSFIQEATGFNFVPVQANLSKSAKGVVRGIHYSLATRGQAKLVTVVSGSIVDYIVDIRIGSPTFGKYVAHELDSSDGASILLAHDLGHCFESKSASTLVSYLVSSEYDPHTEMAISPRCKTLDIQWFSEDLRIISERDEMAPDLTTQQTNHLLPFYRN